MPEPEELVEIPDNDALVEYPDYLKVWESKSTCKWFCNNPATCSFEASDSKTLNVCQEHYELGLQVAESSGLCELCSGIFTVSNKTVKLFSEWGLQHGGRDYLRDSASRGCSLCRLFLLQDPNPDPNRLIGQSISLHADGLFGEEDQWETKLEFLRSLNFESEPDQYRLSISISAEADDPSARYILQRPLETDLGGPATVIKAREWLHGCLSGHEESQERYLPILPTRVLDVLNEDDSFVKLHETNSVEADYVALSYCWGPPPLLRTLTTNYESHLEAIPLESLPITLRDAVVTTRSLGLRYLWIDALCIIQDSDSDRAKEIRTMGDVYSEATITIVAANATSVHEGFLNASSPNRSVRLPFQCPDGNYGSVLVSAVRKVDLQKVAWFTRAWCMQEKFLSKRLLVYTDSEVIWQCETAPLLRQNNVHIDYLNDDPAQTSSPFARLASTVFTSAIPNPASQITDVATLKFDVWANLVTDYTARNLSYGSDKFPAIAGIAQKFRDGWNENYLAGLWESQFINLLQWRRHSLANFKSFRPPATYRAPSWSWASIDGAVEYPRFRTFEVGDMRGLKAQLIHCELDYADPQNALGELRGGQVVLRAAIIKTGDSPFADHVRDGPEAGRFAPDHANPDDELVDDWVDENRVIPREWKESWIMLLGEARREGKTSTVLKGLVLKKIGGEGEEIYQRLGYYESLRKNASKFWAGRQNWKEITIV